MDKMNGAPGFDVAHPYFDGIWAQVTHSLESFEQLRSGKIETFLDTAGCHDDGGRDPARVTPDDVDLYEHNFRQEWSRIWPDLLGAALSEPDPQTTLGELGQDKSLQQVEQEISKKRMELAKKARYNPHRFRQH